jgi:hypothetical protein
LNAKEMAIEDDGTLTVTLHNGKKKTLEELGE